mmetsp:Transcript_12929/g.27284  ORF Transcript_12929/g.27284 Transcript_12929/m.27284 type:complete len:203 (-) Transcript_12929:370-978(-)|eukprot:CAMPEP_0118937152 /NCGR_PEP_ID=MMETSP1169-20130426/21769_1 /TAXON_ID=36882 /ORGANISM="Pyramimonas obovata, Strain CCMP722" /LENGTH=202 /DNA_ID=CAMNT_0006880699 /DNA_START=299 /DNA_END=907 /DNA_ORIENTATION=+
MQSLIDEQASAYAYMDKYEQNTATPYVVPHNSPLSLLIEDQNSASSSSGSNSILEDEDGNLVELSFLKGKLVGFYFSAGWCPPCRAFSPQLADFARSHADEFVVIFVSSDNSEAEMKTFVKEKGFLQVRWNSSVRHQLVQYLGVSSLPTLTICNADTGVVVTDWGRTAMLMNSEHCLQEWQRGLNGISILGYLGLRDLNCMG